jgi:fructokinase
VSRAAIQRMSSLSGRPLIFGEVLFDTFDDGVEVLGGAPFNVAWHLRGFGLAPLFVSRIGEDERGARVFDAMRDWGLDVSGVQRDPGRPTGIVRVTLSSGQPSFDIVPDQAYDFIADEPVRTVLANESVAMMYHGSLALRGPDSRATAEALRALTGAPVFIDVNLRPPWWRADILANCLRGATWVKLNDNELIELGTVSGTAHADLDSAARAFFLHYGLQVLILTRGAQGATVFGVDSEVNGAPPAVERLIDTVGAGDAFSAVMILGLMRGWELSQILPRALEFAARICAQRGATANDPALYRQFLTRWEDGDV